MPRTVRLSEPLGDRAVVDLSTGRRVPVLDLSELPTLTRVPAGYREEPPQRTAGGRVQRVWADEHGRRIRLLLDQWRGRKDDSGVSGSRIADVQVLGEPAAVYAEHGEATVVLQPGEHVVATLLLDARPGGWTVEQATAVARSVRGYRPDHRALPAPTIRGSVTTTARGTGAHALDGRYETRGGPVLAALDCRGDGYVRLTVGRRSATVACRAGRVKHATLDEPDAGDGPVRMTVVASSGVEWTVALAGAESDRG